jgi:hypothetical protein
LIVVAAPKKEDNGTNLTLPFDKTVYVPSPGTVNEDNEHAEAVETVEVHNLTVVAFNKVPSPAASLVTGTNV